MRPCSDDEVQKVVEMLGLGKTETRPNTYDYYACDVDNPDYVRMVTAKNREQAAAQFVKEIEEADMDYPVGCDGKFMNVLVSLHEDMKGAKEYVVEGYFSIKYFASEMPGL